MFDTSIGTYFLDENLIKRLSINIEEPRMCFHCKNTGDQLYVTGCGTLGKKDKAKGGICIFVCQFCGSHTIHFMELTKKENFQKQEDENDYYFKSVETYPSLIMYTAEISEKITEISPDFCRIYDEALIAEKQGLSSISGMAYRKSLEFLVTDFLLKYKPDGVTEEFLKNPDTTLSNKLNKLKTERLRNLARAISFIGNDETHYTRRHPEHDTQSIKIFLNSFLSEIQNELTYLDAEKLLNKPK